MPKTDDTGSTHRGLRALLPVALVIVAAACGEKERSFVANISDGDNSPTMTTLEVETFISDSGYTRYHLSTPIWMMYEDASEPFWRFPDGLDMQQYDLELKPDASMVCDSAIYFSRKRLWRLDGHVVMVNTMRDTFLSQQLFWDQAKRKVYTDSFIHIVRSDRTIEGYGFESDQSMLSYTVNHPTAILPANNFRRGEDKDKTADSAAAVAGRPAVPVRDSQRRPATAPADETAAAPAHQLAIKPDTAPREKITRQRLKTAK